MDLEGEVMTLGVVIILVILGTSHVLVLIDTACSLTKGERELRWRFSLMTRL